MQRNLAIITAIVVGTLALAVLIPNGAAQAQTVVPTAIYKTYIPMVAGPKGSQAPADSLIAAQVLAIVNSERAATGCGPLTLETRLSDAAQGHSQDMALNNYFSHSGSDGSSASKRVSDTGYDWQMTGENIAAGYTTPSEVMEGWMNSSGHRANILNCSYTQMGLGYYYEDGDSYPGPYGYNHYWTQVFARP